MIKAIREKFFSAYLSLVPPCPSLRVNYSAGPASASYLVGSRKELTRLRHEEDLYPFLFEEIQPHDVFYDIGANTGPITCLVADIIETGEVLAFEPHSKTKQRLDENCQLLDNSDSVRTFEVALSDYNGIAGFRIPNDQIGEGTQHLEEEGDARVAVRRGDCFVTTQSLPTPTVIKIDVEGAEQKVLEGLRETVKAPGCRSIFCEVHLPDERYRSINDYGGSPQELEQLLEDLGFAVSKILTRERVYVLKAVK